MLVLEILAVFTVAGLIAWGFWHEDKVIAWEDRMIEKVKEWKK